MRVESIVPAGVCGDWSVEKRVIDGERVTWLKHFRDTIMVDNDNVCTTLFGLIPRLSGDILVNGLGLGLFVQFAMSRLSSVRSVTFIEKQPEVIELVEKHILDYGAPFKVSVLEGDARTFDPTDIMPKTGYDFVYQDIWSSISFNNIPDIVKLCRRWAVWTKDQTSWPEESGGMIGSLIRKELG